MKDEGRRYIASPSIIKKMLSIRKERKDKTEIGELEVVVPIEKSSAKENEGSPESFYILDSMIGNSDNYRQLNREIFLLGPNYGSILRAHNNNSYLKALAEELAFKNLQKSPNSIKRNKTDFPVTRKQTRTFDNSLPPINKRCRKNAVCLKKVKDAVRYMARAKRRKAGHSTEQCKKKYSSFLKHLKGNDFESKISTAKELMVKLEKLIKPKKKSEDPENPEKPDKPQKKVRICEPEKT
eukprot:TRINITY_DN14490_c0_g2_i5.p1 TRINITY_DN14490_c0_g2~~TRINITY_DN14490_c0_g2_i5.p1  ORF type:complete len:239 (-),score=44.22 TRINITY_DN14490_c0_g2_i5:120-836(-)